MTGPGAVTDKVKEIEAEMKRAGLWSKLAPEWVSDYAGEAITTKKGFAAWLQFVYLPNRTNHSATLAIKHIAPQAMRFFGEDVQKGQLLRLLIELDAL